MNPKLPIACAAAVVFRRQRSGADSTTARTGRRSHARAVESRADRPEYLHPFDHQPVPQGSAVAGKLEPELGRGYVHCSAAPAQSGTRGATGGITAGSIVQTPAGEPIGRVRDIVPNANTGEPAYIVISTRSGSTAVPYPTIAPMFQSGHIVLDRSRLESAPRVTDSQLQDNAGAQWKKQADRYWESRKPPNLR